MRISKWKMREVQCIRVMKLGLLERLECTEKNVVRLMCIAIVRDNQTSEQLRSRLEI